MVVVIIAIIVVGICCLHCASLRYVLAASFCDPVLPVYSQEGALASAVREAYSLLQLITFFTTGEQESRAWRLRTGGDAAAAASVIHTDIGQFRHGLAI